MAKKVVKKKAVKKAAVRKPAARKTTKATTARKKTAAAKKPSPANQSQPITEMMMTQNKSKFEKLSQDAAKNGKEQVEALIESGNLFMKGFEDFTKTYVDLAQSAAERNNQAVKALLSCKTINEFAETQNKWVQQNFDDFMATGTKLSELTIKIATDAFEPINDQFSKTVKKAGESLAA
ncbi:MAG: phasin family protein [Rhodospirillales bacterium]|nr:phasin family protein [Rhodospirillales bacterium]MCB9997221.1 phasin family protein [Rhodospirillales bacterium]